MAAPIPLELPVISTTFKMQDEILAKEKFSQRMIATFFVKSYTAGVELIIEKKKKN